MSLLDLKKEYKGKPQGVGVSRKELYEILSVGAQTNRNAQLTKLAGFLNAKDIKNDYMYLIVDAINRARNMNLDDSEVKTIVQSVSAYKNKRELEEDAFRKHLKMYEHCVAEYGEKFTKYGLLKTGWERADKILQFFFPQEVLYIAARSGVGKTTMGLSLGNNITKFTQNSESLFVSLEMGGAALGFRLTNMELSRRSGQAYSSEDCANVFQKNIKLLSKIIDEKPYKYLKILDKSAINLEQLEKYVKVSGCQNIIIDYLGYMQGKGKDAYERNSAIAKGIKALAKSTDTRIIVLSQTSREGEDGTKPVQMHHMRDSGAIEESADWIIGTWQNKDDKRILHNRFLKARNAGEVSEFDLINKGLHLEEQDFSYVEQKKESRF